MCIAWSLCSAPPIRWVADRAIGDFIRVRSTTPRGLLAWVFRVCQRSRSSAAPRPVLIGRRQIERQAQPAGATPIEHRILHPGQEVGPRREIDNALVERHRAAAGRQAIALIVGATVVRAEPTEIAIGARLEQENIELVTDYTDADARLIGGAQGSCRRPPQLAEPRLGVQPKRQIQIATVVQDLDAL